MVFLLSLNSVFSASKKRFNSLGCVGVVGVVGVVFGVGVIIGAVGLVGVGVGGIFGMVKVVSVGCFGRLRLANFFLDGSVIVFLCSFGSM